MFLMVSDSKAFVFYLVSVLDVEDSEFYSKATTVKMILANIFVTILLSLVAKNTDSNPSNVSTFTHLQPLSLANCNPSK